MVSPLPLKYVAEEYFSKNCLSWGTNFLSNVYRGIVLHCGTNDQMIPKMTEFH